MVLLVEVNGIGEFRVFELFGRYECSDEHTFLILIYIYSKFIQSMCFI